MIIKYYDINILLFVKSLKYFEAFDYFYSFEKYLYLQNFILYIYKK